MSATYLLPFTLEEVYLIFSARSMAADYPGYRSSYRREPSGLIRFEKELGEIFLFESYGNVVVKEYSGN